VLSSPVTLCDFPAVAPESPGDLFDGGEIDQLLILSVLSLTPQEQREARAADPRARAILDRCAALSPRELMSLHGAIRDVRSPEESS
jgi:hydrogenase maturation protease